MSLALLMSATTSLAQSAGVRQATGLRILQTVSDPITPRLQQRSELVPIHFGASIVNTTPHDRKSTPTSYQVQVPYAHYGDKVRTQAEILTQAKSILTVAAGQRIGRELKKAVLASKASSGVFLFDQEVWPKASPRAMRLVWSVTLTDDGKVLIPDAKIVDPDPTIIHLTYTSSDATAELPEAWRHFDAGILTWQLKKADGTELTAKVRISTSGAFNGVVDDPDRMVNCLANREFHAACPKTFVDAKTLMADTSSGSAIIDYVRKLEPAYEEMTVGGESNYRPKFSVSVDLREYDRASCTYRNKGRVGALLTTTVDRYSYVSNADQVQFNNRFTRHDVSPEHQYDLTSAVEDASVSLASRVIDPISKDAPIIPTSSLPELVYMAPVTTPSNLIMQQPPKFIFGTSVHNPITYQGQTTSFVITPEGKFTASIGYKQKSNPFRLNSAIQISFYEACKNQFESLVLHRVNYKNWARIAMGTISFHQNSNSNFSGNSPEVHDGYYNAWTGNPAVLRTESAVQTKCPSGQHDGGSLCLAAFPFQINAGWLWASEGRQTDDPIILNVNLLPSFKVGWNTVSLFHAFHPTNPTPAGFEIQGQFKKYE